MVMRLIRWAHDAEYEGLKAAVESAVAGQVLPGVSPVPGKTLVGDQRSLPAQVRSLLLAQQQKHVYCGKMYTLQGLKAKDTDSANCRLFLRL